MEFSTNFHSFIEDTDSHCEPLFCNNIGDFKERTVLLIGAFR